MAIRNDEDVQTEAHTLGAACEKLRDRESAQ